MQFFSKRFYKLGTRVIHMVTIGAMIFSPLSIIQPANASLIINTNTASLTASQQLGRTQEALQRSFQRLSSGLRINSASDEAAGLAVSESLRTQVRSMEQAMRATNAAATAVQSAEGAVLGAQQDLNMLRDAAAEAQGAAPSITPQISSALTNLAAAESQLRDADLATEAAATTKAATAEQAGTEALANANQTPQNVISILRDNSIGGGTSVRTTPVQRDALKKLDASIKAVQKIVQDTTKLVNNYFKSGSNFVGRPITTPAFIRGMNAAQARLAGVEKQFVTTAGWLDVLAQQSIKSAEKVINEAETKKVAWFPPMIHGSLPPADGYVAPPVTVNNDPDRLPDAPVTPAEKSKFNVVCSPEISVVTHGQKGKFILKNIGSDGSLMFADIPHVAWNGDHVFSYDSTEDLLHSKDPAHFNVIYFTTTHDERGEPLEKFTIPVTVKWLVYSKTGYQMKYQNITCQGAVWHDDNIKYVVPPVTVTDGADRAPDEPVTGSSKSEFNAVCTPESPMINHGEKGTFILKNTGSSAAMMWGEIPAVAWGERTFEYNTNLPVGAGQPNQMNLITFSTIKDERSPAVENVTVPVRVKWLTYFGKNKEKFQVRYQDITCATKVLHDDKVKYSPPPVTVIDGPDRITDAPVKFSEKNQFNAECAADPKTVTHGERGMFKITNTGSEHALMFAEVASSAWGDGHQISYGTDQGFSAGNPTQMNLIYFSTTKDLRSNSNETVAVPVRVKWIVDAGKDKKKYQVKYQDIMCQGRVAHEAVVFTPDGRRSTSPPLVMFKVTSGQLVAGQENTLGVELHDAQGNLVTVSQPQVITIDTAGIATGGNFTLSPSSLTNTTGSSLVVPGGMFSVGNNGTTLCTTANSTASTNISGPSTSGGSISLPGGGINTNSGSGSGGSVSVIAHGGNGGNGGSISVNSGSGSISVGGDINSSGGGGGANINAGGNGGNGGAITVTAGSGGITVSGPILAAGGGGGTPSNANGSSSGGGGGSFGGGGGGTGLSVNGSGNITQVGTGATISSPTINLLSGSGSIGNGFGSCSAPSSAAGPIDLQIGINISPQDTIVVKFGGADVSSTPLRSATVVIPAGQSAGSVVLTPAAGATSVQVTASGSGVVGTTHNFSIVKPTPPVKIELPKITVPSPSSPAKVESPPAPPSKLAITSGAQSVLSSQCSSDVAIERQDSSGKPTTEGTTVVNVSSPTGFFYSDASCNNLISNAAIKPGASTVSIYFMSFTVGPLTMTVSTPGFISVTQMQSVIRPVTAAAPAASTASTFTSLAFTTAAQTVNTNQCSGAITIKRVDQNANTFTGGSNEIVITSSLGGSNVYSDSGCSSVVTSVTFASGDLTKSFYFKSTNAGTSNVVVRDSVNNSITTSQNEAVN